MRKLGTIGALAMAAAILFTSCEKIETSELTLDLTQTATVKVNLYADLNHTTNGLESVPNGTNVIVSIPNSAFNSTASGLWTTDAVVANGSIEVTVPATNNGVTVTFTPAEFLYAQVQVFGSNVPTIQKLFKATAAYSLGSVKPGETRSYDITYNNITPPINYTETVSKKFELRADIDETTIGQELVPQGTSVTFYTSDWSLAVSVQAAGRVEISVPKSETIYARFEATKTLNTAPVTAKKYRYDTTVGSYSETSPVVSSVYFGSGQQWE